MGVDHHGRRTTREDEDESNGEELGRIPARGRAESHLPGVGAGPGRWGGGGSLAKGNCRTVKHPRPTGETDRAGGPRRRVAAAWPVTPRDKNEPDPAAPP